MKYRSYEIIMGDTVRELEEKVNEVLMEGAVLIGGPFTGVFNCCDDRVLSQAVAMIEKD